MQTDIVAEYALGSEEDAPMTLAVTTKVNHFILLNLQVGHHCYWDKSISFIHIHEKSEQASSYIRNHTWKDSENNSQTAKASIPNIDTLQPRSLPTSNQIQSLHRSKSPWYRINIRRSISCILSNSRNTLLYQSRWRNLLT
jgi:hypothetical protein